ncbi:unnamed protein product [Bursaphelenchus okinawaensis]|uniref:Galectin n=1 Tax=Bursaphelenchus okinawaensis TaxID=465554 RepID=A0A811LIX2_9BILA|nr:unnamed protein product [Bursaphelenchus okinawaensis]CAG9123215.1 unnamed protein product [Bursaphelenchus okinawaensis]
MFKKFLVLALLALLFVVTNAAPKVSTTTYKGSKGGNKASLSNDIHINSEYSQARRIRFQGLSRGDVIVFGGTLDKPSTSSAKVVLSNLESGRTEFSLEMDNHKNNITIKTDKDTITVSNPPKPRETFNGRIELANYNLIRVIVNGKLVGEVETSFIGGAKNYTLTGDLTNPHLKVDESNRLPIYKKIRFGNGQELDFTVSLKEDDLSIFLLDDEDYAEYSLRTHLNDSTVLFGKHYALEEGWSDPESFPLSLLKPNKKLSIKLKFENSKITAVFNGQKDYKYQRPIEIPSSGYFNLFVDSFDASVTYKQKNINDWDD